MSSKKKTPNALLITLLVAILTYLTLWLLQSHEEITPILKKIALSTYQPSALDALAGQPSLHWMADYALFTLIFSLIITQVILFLIALFFVEPNPAPVHDSTNMTDLMGAPAPHFNHLSDALFTCPGLEANQIELEMASEGFPSTASPQKKPNPS